MMERLTGYNSFGGAYALGLGCEDYHDNWETIHKIINRLAAYEDTGLEPGDVISAKDMAKIACALHELNAYKDIGSIDRLRELAQADKEGRVIITD